MSLINTKLLSNFYKPITHIRRYTNYSNISSTKSNDHLFFFTNCLVVMGGLWYIDHQINKVAVKIDDVEKEVLKCYLGFNNKISQK